MWDSVSKIDISAVMKNLIAPPHICHILHIPREARTPCREHLLHVIKNESGKKTCINKLLNLMECFEVSLLTDMPREVDFLVRSEKCHHQRNENGLTKKAIAHVRLIYLGSAFEMNPRLAYLFSGKLSNISSNMRRLFGSQFIKASSTNLICSRKFKKGSVYFFDMRASHMHTRRDFIQCPLRYDISFPKACALCGWTNN